MAQIKLGELLIKANVLQESQRKAALAEQAKWGGKLGEILVRMSLVSEDIRSGPCPSSSTSPR
jgi:hypothetical protein